MVKIMPFYKKLKYNWVEKNIKSSRTVKWITNYGNWALLLLEIVNWNENALEIVCLPVFLKKESIYLSRKYTLQPFSWRKRKSNINFGKPWESHQTDIIVCSKTDNLLKHQFRLPSCGNGISTVNKQITIRSSPEILTRQWIQVQSYNLQGDVYQNIYLDRLIREKPKFFPMFWRSR